MKLKTTTSLLFVVGLAGLGFLGSALPAQGQGSIYGRGERRLEGQRFTTMRALAHRLDEAATTALLDAESVEAGGPMTQRFFWAISDFARQARSLHERLEQYDDTPWDIADEVAALNQRATQVSRQLRTANAFPETHQDWAEVVAALNLMNRALRGENVALPPDRNHRYTPFDENTRYQDGRHVDGYGVPPTSIREGLVTGAELRVFRRHANALNVEVMRLLGLADRARVTNTLSQRSFADLSRFAQRTSDLARSTSYSALNARETAAVVGQMLDNARLFDRNMRDEQAVVGVDWSGPIRILEQMAVALPRP